MSGILRLANTGVGTGRSTLQSAASNDVTFNLPDTGSDSTATILTSDLHSITSVNWDGMTINITNADFNVDSGTLFVDESTNRVGIGTNAPAEKLTVADVAPGSGFSATSGQFLRSNYGGQIGGYIDQGVNHGLIFSVVTAGTASEKVRILNNGNVGIGNTEPEGNLHVGSAVSFVDSGANTIVSNNGSHQRLVIAGGPTHVKDIQFRTTSDTTNKGIIRYDANEDMRFYTNNSEKVRIESNGNVGIGTTQANFLLHLDGGHMHRFRETAGSATTPHEDALVTYGSTTAPFGGMYAINQYSTDTRTDLAFKVTNNTGSIYEALRIRYDGNVGIGTDSPLNKLTINGEVGVPSAGGVLGVQQKGDTINDGITLSSSHPNSVRQWVDSDGALNFRSTFTSDNFLTLTKEGNVGIGTDSPGADLEIAGDSARIRLNRTDGTNTYSEVSASTGGLFLSSRNNASNGQIIFQGTGGGTADEHMRIDSSGRLLVGTSYSSPHGTATSKVQIVGTTDAHMSLSRSTENSSQATFTLSKSRGTPSSPTIVSNGDVIGSLRFAGYDGTDFNTKAAEITCTVDDTPGANNVPGRLMFYTTASGDNTPTERMRITQDGVHHIYGAANVLGIRSATAASTANVFISARHSATGIVNGGTISFEVKTNGNVVNTNNSYEAISDIKLKKNIVDASSQWDDIKALRPVNYNFKEGQTHTQLGLIAQEVELVCPGLVSEYPDRDEKDNDLGTVTKSVNYSVLYMKAVKALQEAMERIEVLEGRVKNLEG